MHSNRVIGSSILFSKSPFKLLFGSKETSFLSYSFKKKGRQALLALLVGQVGLESAIVLLGDYRMFYLAQHAQMHRQA